MQGFRAHCYTSTSNIFVGLLALYQTVKVLKVSKIARAGDDGSVVDFMHPLRIGVPGQATIVSTGISRNHNTIFELKTENRSAGSDGILRVVSRVGHVAFWLNRFIRKIVVACRSWSSGPKGRCSVSKRVG